jgi:hypothetical protein
VGEFLTWRRWHVNIRWSDTTNNPTSEMAPAVTQESWWKARGKLSGKFLQCTQTEATLLFSVLGCFTFAKRMSQRSPKRVVAVML